MSKEEIDRILNTDFAEMDHTIQEKINSIDEMTGKLNEKSSFLAQFQLMLQSQLGNIKSTGKMVSSSKEGGDNCAIVTKKVEIPKVEEQKPSAKIQKSKYYLPPYEPKVKQPVVLHKKIDVSVGTNPQQKSFEIENVVNMQLYNLQTQKIRNKQNLGHIRCKLDEARIQLSEFKLLIIFLKQEIKAQIEYFKEKITLEASQTYKNLQANLQSQHQIYISSLEAEINILKTQIQKVILENKALIQTQNPLKELTYHKNIQEKISSFNVTRRFKEIQSYPSQYSSPDPHKISPNQIINSDQWKTNRLRFDENQEKKTERPQFKQKQTQKDPYTIPTVKTITVGIPPIKNGFGILKSGSQIIYRGMWKDGKFDGSGKLNWEGYCYQGNFSNGAFQGHGRLHIKDIIFVGKFKSNKACGEGTLQIERKKIVGVWENNQLIRIF